MKKTNTMLKLKNLGFIFSLMLCLVISEATAQDFSIITYNAEFENCETELESLYRIGSGANNLSAKYLLNDEPYTGCAKSKMLPGCSVGNGNTSIYANYVKSTEYMVSFFQDGYATKSLYYFNSGHVSRDFNYKNGKSHGIHVMYYEDGSKYIEEYYENGQPVGSQKRWYEDGEIWRDAYYSNGVQIFQKFYDKDGNLTEDGC